MPKTDQPNLHASLSSNEHAAPNDLLLESVPTMYCITSSLINAVASVLPKPFVRYRSDYVECRTHHLHGHDIQRNLAVIQVHFVLKNQSASTARVSSAYYLVGLTAWGEPFRLSVHPQTVHRAAKDNGEPSAVVEAVEKWLFGLKHHQYASGVSHGDVFGFPLGARPPHTHEFVDCPLHVLNTQLLRATQLVRDANMQLYAYDPVLYDLQERRYRIFANDSNRWWRIKFAR